MPSAIALAATGRSRGHRPHLSPPKKVGLLAPENLKMYWNIYFEGSLGMILETVGH